MRALVIALILTWATSAWGTINLGATCSGNTVTVSLAVCNNYSSDMTGIVIQRWEIGTCAAPEILTKMPLPLPQPGNPYVSGDWVHYAREFPVPFPNVNYRYVALVADSAGATHRIENGSFPTWDCQPAISAFASCEDAVIMRARFTRISGDASWVYLLIVPCADGCWGASGIITVPTIDPLANIAIEGVVDVYGTARSFRCFGVQGGPYEVTRIEPAPGGACGPVPAESTSFGTLKAMYR